MEPIKRGQLEHNVDSATIVFLNSGESKTLGTKPASVCHFFDPFQVENDIITLRLDWSELDEYGHPTLDADFVDKNTNKKRSLKGERKEAHHTSSSGKGGRNYAWEFKGYKRPFQVMVTWLLSGTVKGETHCSASLDVKHTSDDSSE